MSETIEATASFRPRSKNKLVWAPSPIEVPEGAAVRLTCPDGDFGIVFDGKSPFPGGLAFNSQNKVLLQPTVKPPGHFKFKCFFAQAGLPGLATDGDEIVIVASRVGS